MPDSPAQKQPVSKQELERLKIVREEQLRDLRRRKNIHLNHFLSLWTPLLKRFPELNTIPTEEHSLLELPETLASMRAQHETTFRLTELLEDDLHRAKQYREAEEQLARDVLPEIQDEKHKAHEDTYGHPKQTQPEKPQYIDHDDRYKELLEADPYVHKLRETRPDLAEIPTLAERDDGSLFLNPTLAAHFGEIGEGAVDVFALEEAARMKFRGKYAEDAARYDENEKHRLYEDPKTDPAIIRMEREIKAKTDAEVQRQRDYHDEKAKTTFGYSARKVDAAAIETKIRRESLLTFAREHPEKANGYLAKDPTLLPGLPGAVTQIKAEKAAAEAQARQKAFAAQQTQQRRAIYRHAEAVQKEQFTQEPRKSMFSAGNLRRAMPTALIGGQPTGPNDSFPPPVSGGSGGGIGGNGRRPNLRGNDNSSRRVKAPNPTASLATNLVKQAIMQNPWVRTARWLIPLILFIVFLIILLIIIITGGGGSEKPPPGSTPVPVAINKAVDVTEVPNPPDTKDVTYTMTVTYPGTATDVTVEDPIPTGAVFVKADPAGKTVDASNKETSDPKQVKKVIWSLKDIQHGVNTSPSPSSSPSPSAKPSASPSGEACTVGTSDDPKWAKINKFDTYFTQASQEFGVPANLLKAMAYIESGGQGMYNPDGSVIIRGCDGTDCAPAIGMMQVKPAYHYDQLGMTSAQQATEYVKTPEGNVRMAAAILADGYKQYGSWDNAILGVYFTSDDVNGTTQEDYINNVHALMAELEGGACNTSKTNTPPGSTFANQTLKLTVRAVTNNTYLINQATAQVTGGSTIGPSTSSAPGPSVSVAPNDDTCGGKYDLNNPFKNFGDASCNFDKDKLYAQLQSSDPANADFWFNQIVPCESQFNPNAYNGDSTSGLGGYGLFQMNPDNQGKNQYDVGNVDWPQQATNAITYNSQVINGSFAYWECAQKK